MRRTVRREKTAAPMEGLSGSAPGAPRALARVCLSFSGATALSVLVLNGGQMLLLGALGLLTGLASLLRRHVLPGAMLLAVTAGAWLCWFRHMHLLTLEMDWADTTVTLTAQAQDYPRETAYGYALEVRAYGALEGEHLLLYLDEAADIRPGDEVSGEVDLRSARETASGRTYSYYADGISLRGSAEGLTVTRRDTPWTLLPRVWAHALWQELGRLFPSEETAGFLLALATGNRDALPEVLEDALSETGLSHVVAASGLHVSLLISALALLPGSQRTRSLLLLPGLLAFAALAGFTPSICRAALMQAVSLFAPICRREEDPPTSLALALAVILLGNPVAIASVSLQLSFAAMLGLTVLGPRLYRLLEGRPAWLIRIAITLGNTLAATVFTLPLVLWYFGRSSLIAPLSNLLVLWILPLLLPAALFCPLLGLLCPAAGELLALPVGWVAAAVIRLIHALAGVPFAALRADQPRVLAWLLLCYAAGALWFTGLLRGRRRAVLTALLLAAALGLSLRLQAEDGARWALEIAVLDVGQGQCILLAGPEGTAVIDCGSTGGDSAAELEEALAERGLERVDALLLTHWDEDHVSGVEKTLASVPVDALYLPAIPEEGASAARAGTLADAAQDSGVALCWTGEASELTLGETRMELLPVRTEQGMAQAVLVRHGDFTLLITGDLTITEEEMLLETYSLPEVSVLVGGHHGSRYATGTALLEAVRPQAVLFSVGANPYGHPTGEALARVAESGACVFRTDRNGEIDILLPRR